MKTKSTSRLIAALLAVLMILAIIPTAFAGTFTDVTDDKWYAEAVEYCVSNDIMSGVGDGEFDPDGTVTREQGVQALYALDGSKAVDFEALFSDVEDGKWFAPAVIWGAKNEVVAGIGDGKFGVGENVTREQMATFFFRYAAYAGADTSAADDLAAFPDKDDTSSWAVDAVKWAVAAGIISGKENNGETLLKPQDELTRAELASIMMRFHKLINEPPIDEDLIGKTVILHSNDVHGAIAGYAYIAGLKADFEARGAEVILADAGDYSQGTTNVSLSKGANAVSLMNLVGYDIATLGNHEFDYGAAQMFDNLSKAEFAITCSDVLKDGAPIFDAYTIIEKGGVKIAFIGLETPEAQTKANPTMIQGLTFLTNDTDPKLWDNTQTQVDAAKAAGADLVIALAHLGVDGESMPYRSVDLWENVTGLDFVIDGHSHTVMVNGPQGEPIQSTGTAFANVGAIVIDNETKAIEKNYLIPVTDDTPADGAVAAAAQEIIDAIAAEYGEKFAESLVDLNGDKAPNGNRDSETNNGDFITDAMIWCVTEQYPGSITEVPEENIVAITNGGGIRAWIYKGDVTKNDILTVLPFGNTVAVVYVTGAELLEALEASTYCTPEAVGGFPQVAGINFTIETYKEYDANAETYPGSTYYGPASINRVTIQDINGQPFDPAAKYAIVTNNFCAGGGDTYYAFAAASSQFDTGYTLDAVVMDYVTEKLDGVIGMEYAEPQGRITIKTEPDIPPVPADEYAIYYPVASKVMTTESFLYVNASGTTQKNELVAADAALVDGKIQTAAENVAKFTKIDNDGVITFKTADGKFLYADGTDVKLADEESDYTKFVLEDAEGGTLIKCLTAEYQGKPQYLEFYGGYFTVYGLQSSNANYTFVIAPVEYKEICNHNWDDGKQTAPTCTEPGEIVFTCTKCGEIRTEPIEALGHVDADKDKICDRCGAQLTEPIPVDNAFVKVTEAPADWSGEYLIVYETPDGSAKVFNGQDAAGSYVLLPGIEDGMITLQSGMCPVIIEKMSGGYSVDVNGLYMSNKGASTNGTNFGTTPKATTFTLNADGTVAMECGSCIFRFNTNTGDGNDRFRYYKPTSTSFPMISLYKRGNEPACAHEWDNGVATTPATCVLDGEMTYTCSLCGKTKTQVIPALGHIDANADKLCDRCGYDMSKPAGDPDLFTKIDCNQDDWSGEYLIVYELDDGSAKVFSGVDETGAYVKLDFITDNQIKIRDGMARVIVEKMNGGYSVKVGSQYMYNKSASANGTNFGPSPKATTFMYNIDGTVTMTCDSCIFRFNTGTATGEDRFRYYKSTSTSFPMICLYKAGLSTTCEHLWDDGDIVSDPTCTEDGLVVCHCVYCGATKNASLAALGHIDSDENNFCDRCGADLSLPPVQENAYYKVTSNLADWSGEYLIVYEVPDDGGAKIFNGTDGSGSYYKLNQLSGDKIDFADGMCSVVIEKMSGGYSVKVGSQYMYNSGASSNGTSFGSSPKATNFTSNADGTVKMECGTCVFRFNTGVGTGEDRFRYYKATSTGFPMICLYRKGASAPCVHEWDEGVINKDATCTAAGERLFTCSKCGTTKTEPIPALGHIDANEDKICDRCGADIGTPVPPIGGTAYIKVTEDQTDWSGEYLIVYELTDGSAKVFNGQDATGEYVKVSSISDNTIYFQDGMCSVVVEKMSGGYSVKVGDQYMSNKSTTANGTTFSSTPKATNFTVNGDGTVSMECGTCIFRFNTGVAAGEDRFRYYKPTTTSLPIICLYKLDDSTACKHEWGEGEITTDATCTAAGVKTYTCALCGATKTESIPALGHIDANEDKICDRCGADLGVVPPTPPVGGDKVYKKVDANLSDWTGEYLIVYELADGSAKVFNGQDATGEYVKLSSITDNTIEFQDGMCSVIVEPMSGGYSVKVNDQYMYNKSTSANGTSFGTTPKATTFTYNADGTVKMDCGTCVFRFNTGVATGEDRFRYYKPSSTSLPMICLYKLDSSAVACDHDWGEGAVTTDATCLEAGVLTYTCSKCGATRTEAIAALGHIDENEDNLCDRCGADLGVVPPTPPVGGDKVYKKVTSNLSDWSGEYLIVYELADGSAKVFNGQDATGEYVKLSSITNDQIPFADGMCSVIVEPMSGGYSVKVNGQYMYNKSTSANGTSFGSSPKATNFTYNSDGTVKMECGTCVFRFNTGVATGEDRFRYYKPSSTSLPMICLYKLAN